MNRFELFDGGSIKALTLNGHKINFRQDEYRGFQFLITKNDREFPIVLDNNLTAEFEGIIFKLAYEILGETLKVTCKIANTNDFDYNAQKISVRLGIDCYMQGFPQWDECLFPTMLRCEKTHFWGYFSSPGGNVLGVCSPDAVASWSLDYNRAQYGDENHVGHRIYSAVIDFFSTYRQPSRHPQNLQRLSAHETKVINFYLSQLDNTSALNKFVSDYALAPYIECENYTLEIGDKLSVSTDAEKLCILSPDNCQVDNFSTVTKTGYYKIFAEKKGKISEAIVYVRAPYEFYIKNAAKACFEAQQKPATHTESWYGFFSAFAYLKYYKDEALLRKTITQFDNLISVLYQGEKLEPDEKMLPGRIQNHAGAISALCDAYEVTKDIKYLNYATRLGDYLMTYQASDGSYRNDDGTHYTCVIYIAKSLLELSDAEKDIYPEKSMIHFESVKAAIADLVLKKDNIETEGEQTFEDGMISCEALQIAFYALHDDTVRDSYANVAEFILKKHRCLELTEIPDARMRGATLRFWESMYDILIDRNMMISPHGWTSWKTYATYYLYLLTGKYEYLRETMDTIGTCMQCIDLESGKLRWGFVVDPSLKVNQFLSFGGGTLHERVIGEEHLDMISYWWKSDNTKIVKGFAFPHRNIVRGEYEGGCCDNDVHEHFKCLEEVALNNSFVHQIGNEFKKYNCDFSATCGKIKVETKVENLYFYSETDAEILVNSLPYKVNAGLNHIKL